MTSHCERTFTGLPGKAGILCSFKGRPITRHFSRGPVFTMDVIRAARSGYVVIVQDVRGRWESEGKEFIPYRDEFDDGYDTVEWAASLPYSDGNVGMFGYSYYAATQWRAAAMRPPHLKAIFPFAGAMDYYLHRGGAVELGALVSWLLLLAGPNGSCGPGLGLRSC